MAKFTLNIVCADDEIDEISFEESHSLDMIRQKVREHLSAKTGYIPLGLHNVSLEYIHNSARDVFVTEGWPDVTEDDEDSGGDPSES